MQEPIGLLSDNINWVQPLVRAMDTAGVPSQLISLPDPPFTEFDGSAYPDVILNRVAIRTAMGSPGAVTLIRDLLSALQLQGKQIINNRQCHHVGSSKALQSLVFQQAGVMSPKTLVLHDKAMLQTARKQMPDGMLKSNVGSVEYLIPEGESTAYFFDINPVSTYHPRAADFLGFNPYSKVVAWLKALTQNRAGANIN